MGGSAATALVGARTSAATASKRGGRDASGSAHLQQKTGHTITDRGPRAEVGPQHRTARRPRRWGALQRERGDHVSPPWHRPVRRAERMRALAAVFHPTFGARCVRSIHNLKIDLPPDPGPVRCKATVLHFKSRFLLDTEEIVRTAQAWRTVNS